MGQFKVILFISAVLGFFSIPSYAGPGISGGGDVLLCRKGGIFSKRTPYLADTYTLIKDNVIPLKQGIPEELYLQSFLASFKAQDHELGTALEQRIRELTFNPVKKLKELKDDNISPPRGCKVRQLAIQYVTHEGKRSVDYLPKYLDRLFPAERALFRIHEGFISLRDSYGDTTLIRKKVEDIAGSTQFEKFLVSTIFKTKYVRMPYVFRLFGGTIALWLNGSKNVLGFGYPEHFKDFIRDPSYFKNTFRDQTSGLSSAQRVELASAQSMFFNLLPAYTSIGSNLNWIEMAKIFDRSSDPVAFIAMVIEADHKPAPWVPIHPNDQDAYDYQHWMDLFIENNATAQKMSDFLKEDYRQFRETYDAMIRADQENKY